MKLGATHLDMEASTSTANSSEKRSRKALYDRRQVIDLLLDGSEDEEDFLSSSDSEVDLDVDVDLGSPCVSDSGDESSPRTGAITAPPSKKQKQSNKTTLSTTSKGKGKGKGKKTSTPRSRSRSKRGANQGTDLDPEERETRHLQDLDLPDDGGEADVTDNVIDLSNTEWHTAGADYTPQLHDFEGDGGDNI